MIGIKPICPHFLIRQECTFQISWAWPFSSVTTIFLHLACPGGKMPYPSTFFTGWHPIGWTHWSRVSLTKWEGKTLNLLTAPLVHSPQCPMKGELISWPPSYPWNRHWLKRFSTRFQNFKVYQGRRERGIWICCRAPPPILPGLGNFSSAPTHPIGGLDCEVCWEVLLAPREISAMTEVVDRVQPDLNLRRCAQS